MLKLRPSLLLDSLLIKLNALDDVDSDPRYSLGHFDDVQKAPSLPSKAPREMKELDENQSKKGLGEVYADEYAQKTGLVSLALSVLDEQKKEVSLLFKKLCLKLDDLSHFHFTPKPVIEDMSIQTKVPALAMKEVSTLLETSHYT
ncbi:U3 small nucleolar ribonucleoprotein protein mpp10-like [Cynara cardunculus var. scolymus]|uniref:U3 small nucleolar ribonucleoprotein protein mpp10-like n=1 Tax=Cynara cardunculus var. scolymus TaxID=59895 RepID=UPI000D62D863|nr:U3 small nucleolar ribonucleoprotein protein mpp10-like [Cynara cardunculus var. scolymus]XP_024985201.1 U3 small nucleolar ribonucleoprotein protein mpp10-like [Cynara cardunculus var. scolymus]